MLKYTTLHSILILADAWFHANNWIPFDVDFQHSYYSYADSNSRCYCAGN